MRSIELFILHNLRKSLMCCGQTCFQLPDELSVAVIYVNSVAHFMLYYLRQEVMLYPAFVRLCLCLSVCLLATLRYKLLN